MTEPGRIIASGRDGDIFEFGPGLVLRKTRDGRSIEHEARIIQYVEGHGYPVPKIHDVRANGSEIVMEHIEGPMMMDAMLKPWKMPAMLRTLADLHDQLGAIPAPEWLEQLPDNGDRVVHLDLHPMNVIISPSGPVVIDWSNASRGEPLSDAALTYAMLICPRIPAAAPIRAVLNQVRPLVARQFAKRWWGRAFRERVAIAAELKSLDTNMLPDEIENLHRLAAKMKKSAAG